MDEWMVAGCIGGRMTDWLAGLMDGGWLDGWMVGHPPVQIASEFYYGWMGGGMGVVSVVSGWLVSEWMSG